MSPHPAVIAVLFFFTPLAVISGLCCSAKPLHNLARDNPPRFPIMTVMSLEACNSSWIGQSWFINETDKTLRLRRSPLNAAETYGNSNSSGALVNLWALKKPGSTGGNFHFYYNAEKTQIVSTQGQHQHRRLCLGWETPALRGSVTFLYNCTEPNTFWVINTTSGIFQAKMPPSGNGGNSRGTAPSSSSLEDDVSPLCLNAGRSLPDGPALGNGYLFTRAGGPSLLLNGLTNGRDGSAQQQAPLPASHIMPADESAQPSIFSLDHSTGVASQTFVTDSYSLTIKQYMQRNKKNFYIREVTAERRKSSNSISAAPLTIPLVRWLDALDATQMRRVARNSTSDGRLTVNVYRTLRAEVPAVTPLITVVTVEPAAGLDQQLNITIPAGSNSSAPMILPLLATTDLPYDLYAARSDRRATLVDAALAAYRAFRPSFAEHAAAWAELWNSRFEIEPTEPNPSGAPPPTKEQLGAYTAAVLRESNYMLYSSLRGSQQDPWPYGTACGVLQDCYQSSRLWDQEVWIAPNCILLAPDMAQGAVTYRLDRTAGARDTALNVIKANRGIAFPAQSSTSGYAQGWWGPSKFNEIHWSSDISTFWRRLLHAGAVEGGDTRAFLERIDEPLRQIADFYVSRSTLGTSNYVNCTEGPGAPTIIYPRRGKDSKHGRRATKTSAPAAAVEATTVHLLETVGPDEYHCSSDQIYTNVQARLHMNFTIEVARLLQHQKKGGPSGAVHPEWQAFHDGIAILYDKQRDMHEEFAGYFNLPEKEQIVKQADVSLLAYPLDYKYETPRTLENDLAWYGEHMDPGGPMMTWSVYATAYFSIGRRDLGEKNFVKSYINNTFPPRGWYPNMPVPNYILWTEMISSGGCQHFLTGAGGMMQTVWSGLLGLRIGGGKTDEIAKSNYNMRLMVSKTHLPSFAARVKALGIHFFHARLDIVLEPDSDSASASSNSNSKNNKNSSTNVVLLVTLTQQPLYGGALIVDGGSPMKVNATLRFPVHDDVPDVVILFKNSSSRSISRRSMKRNY